MRSLTVMNRREEILSGPTTHGTDPNPYVLPEGEDLKAVTERAVVDAIRTVFDPELPVNVFDLGLIYRLHLSGKTNDNTFAIEIEMTLTAPNCPVAQVLPENIVAAVSALPAVHACSYIITFDPPWNPGMMSEVARLELNLD